MDQNNAAEGPSLLSCAGALTDSVPDVLSLWSIKKTLPCVSFVNLENATWHIYYMLLGK